MNAVDNLCTDLIEELDRAGRVNWQPADGGVAYAEASRVAAVEVVTAVARIERYNRMWDAGMRTLTDLTCPALFVPSPEELAVWTRVECPADYRLEADKLLTAVCGDLVLSNEGAWWEHVTWNGMDALMALPVYGHPGEALVHAYWLSQGVRRPRHPLAPLVDAWQRLTPIRPGWDTRRHTNVPTSLARTTHVVHTTRSGVGHLPFDWNAHRPAPPTDEPRFEVSYLPYIEQVRSKLPVPTLDLLDLRASRGYRGPVSVPTRVGLELILLPESGYWHVEQATVTPTHAELAGWVWPNTRYQPEKHGPQLYAAARWLNDPDNATRWRRNETARPVLMVTFFAPPFAPYHPDDKIGAHVVLPDGGRKVGPQFDAPPAPRPGRNELPAAPRLHRGRLPLGRARYRQGALGAANGARGEAGSRRLCAPPRRQDRDREGWPTVPPRDASARRTIGRSRTELRRRRRIPVAGRQ